jgi:hypothetical protein
VLNNKRILHACYVLDIEIPSLILITNYHRFYKFLIHMIPFEALRNMFGIGGVSIFSLLCQVTSHS